VPAPIENVRLLIPLAGLRFHSTIAETSATEHALKLVDKQFTERRGSIVEVITSVKKSAKSLLDFIDKSKQKEITKADKAKKDEVKQKLRDEQKAKVQADKEAKAKAKEGGAKIVAQVGGEAQPCLIMTEKLKSFKGVETFEDEAAFATWQASKTTDDYNKMGPYKITSVPWHVLNIFYVICDCQLE